VSGIDSEQRLGPEAARQPP